MIHPTPTERSQRAEAARELAFFCSKLSPTNRSAVAGVVRALKGKQLATVGGALARLRASNLQSGPTLDAIAAAVASPSVTPAGIIDSSAGHLSGVARYLAVMSRAQRAAVAALFASDAPAFAGELLACAGRLSASVEELAAAITTGDPARIERAAATRSKS